MRHRIGLPILFIVAGLILSVSSVRADTKTAEISNGILRATFDGEVFSLAWDEDGRGSEPFLTEMTFQKTWTAKYEPMKTATGVIRIYHELAEIKKVETLPDAPRGPQIRITFALKQPEAAGVRYQQTLTLLRDQPIAQFLATFENTSDQDFYIGERWMPFLTGRFAGKMAGRKVARWGKGWEDDDSVRSGFGRIKWVKERCMSVENPSGYGVAFMILSPDNPLEHYWDFDRWIVGDPKSDDPDIFRLSLLGDKRGGGSINASIQIPAHESETTGVYILACPPEQNTRAAMKAVFQQLRQGQPLEVPKLDSDKTSLTHAPLDAPVIMSPVDNARLTDISVEFRWKRIEGSYDYEIEIADNPHFEGPLRFPAGGESPYLRLDPRTYLKAGDWWWRARGLPFRADAAPGQWTPARRMTVSNDHSPKPPIRKIDASHPLIVVRDNFITLEHLRNLIPEELNHVMAVEFYSSTQITVRQPDTHKFCKEAESYDLYGFLPIDTSLAEAEWAFQHCPNILGLAAGELFYSLPRDPELLEHCHRAMKLCRKYGRFVLWPDMHKYSFLWFADDPVFGDPANAPYFIPLHKTTNPHIALAIQSQVLGWWIGGLAENFGVQIDSWYWSSAGFRKLGDNKQLPRDGTVEDLPPTFPIQQWLLGIMQGGAVIKNECDQPWDDQGNSLELWTRYYLPFFKAVVEHDFIPPADVARAAVKIAVRPELPEEWKHGYLHNFEDANYGPFTNLYQTLYGVSDTVKEWIPQTGRYHFIPILPANTVPVHSATRVISSSRLQDPDEIRRIYDAAYPPVFTGDAYVCRVGDSIVVMTTEENSDVTQDYTIPLDHTLVEEWSGRVGPHKYIMAKLEGDRFWLHANTAYPERSTTLRLRCTSRPAVEVVPASDRHVIQWDEAHSILSVSLDHTQGAVELTVAP